MAAPNKGIVIYDYYPETIDEISLEKGKIVLISEKKENGLWYGMCNGKEGLFPRSFVMLAGGSSTSGDTGSRYVTAGGGNSGSNGPVGPSDSGSDASTADTALVHTELRNTNEKLKEEMRTLEKHNATLTKKLANSDEKTRSLQTKQKRNSTTSDKLTSKLQEELDLANAKIATLENSSEAMADQQEEIEDLKEELKDANSKKNKYKTHSKKADAKNRELRERLLHSGENDHEEELQLASKKVKSMQIEMQELEDEMQLVEDENIKLSAMLKELGH